MTPAPDTRCQLRHAKGWDDCVLDEGLQGSACPIRLRSGEWHISPDLFTRRKAEGTARHVRHVGEVFLDPARGEGFRPSPLLA